MLVLIDWKAMVVMSSFLGEKKEKGMRGPNIQYAFVGTGSALHVTLDLREAEKLDWIGDRV